jgi:hypothetical protein
MVIEIGSMANSIEGISPSWPVVTLTLISVYREEQGKIKAVENWNLTQDKVSQAEENAAKVRQMAQRAASAGQQQQDPDDDDWE